MRRNDFFCVEQYLVYEKAKYFGADAAKETVTIVDTVKEVEYVSKKLIEITKEQDEEWKKNVLPLCYCDWMSLNERIGNYPSKVYTMASPLLQKPIRKSIQCIRT